MRIIPLLAGLWLAGCATSGALPEKAPPFSADRPIHFPDHPTGKLEVSAFPKNPALNRPGTARELEALQRRRLCPRASLARR